MSTRCYVLDDDHNAVPEPDPLKWAKWHCSHDRTVRAETIVGMYRVSTVFWGQDMSIAGLFNTELPPLLYETMVFRCDGSIGVQERCSTWDEAIAQHEAIAAEIRKAVAG
jgi:hypothetical protein